MHKPQKNTECMQLPAPRNPFNGNRINIESGYTLLTKDMRHKIKRHATLTNPTRTVRMLGYKCNGSGPIIARLLFRQHTIRTHFWEKLIADLMRAENDLDERRS